MVWLDSLVTNVDRTPRNPNLLRWHSNLYLIDHGAALYAFHALRPAGAGDGGRSRRSATTCCCGAAGSIDDADARLAARADPAKAAALVPPEWANGDLYAEFLDKRLEGPREWAQEAERARVAR